MKEPVEMLLYSDTYREPHRALVYDFIYDSELNSYALCWDEEIHVWITTPVGYLTPVTKKILNE